MGESSEEEEIQEINFSLMQVLEEPIDNIYCPKCDDDRWTMIYTEMTLRAKIELIIFVLLFFPFAICIYYDKKAWVYRHQCCVCNYTLYSSDLK